LAPQSHVQITQVVETERQLFYGEMIRYTAACCAYKASATEHISSHYFSLLPFHLSHDYSATCCTAPTLRSMAEGHARDPVAANPSADEDIGNDSRAKSIALMTSSPTRGTALMAKGEIPELSNFFNKTSITDEERQAYHDRGWLPGNIISPILELGIPTVEDSTIVCFEPHLVAKLGLPPSKFLSTIMGYSTSTPTPSLHLGPL
jgi:hypothetical protein